MERRPVQARSQRRREQVLRTTLAILRREGIGSVTLRAVAEEARVPLGSVTYYFGDKDGLLREALDLWVAEEVERVATLARAIEEQELSAEEAAARCAELLQANDPEQIAQFELYLHAAHSPPLRGAVEAAFRAYEDVIAAALRAAGVREAERAAPLFLALTDSFGLRRAIVPERTPDLQRALLDLLAAFQR